MRLAGFEPRQALTMRRYVSPMTAHIPGQLAPRSGERTANDLCSILALLLGLVMPLISAWIYPTYRHFMPSPVAESSRLLELPFVVCEALVICWALGRGMELRQLARSLPRDCRRAAALLMLGVWGSTLLVSKVPSISLAISVSTVLHLLFAAAVLHLLRTGRPPSVDRFAIGLGAGLVALAAVTAWRFLLPPPLWQVPGGVIEWSSSLPGFISVRHFGSWTGAVTAIAALLVLQRPRGATWSWREALFLLSAAMTIWSGTRAAVLAIALSCAIAVAGRGRLPDWQIVGRVAVLTIVSTAVAYLLRPHGDQAFFLVRLGDAAGGGVEAFTSGRLSLWIATFQKWLEAPFFGWGSGSTFWEVYTGWPHTQPHNFVLQFLISWGVVGTCGALWLLARATASAHECASADSELWPLYAGLCALLIMALLEGMLHYPRFIMLIAALYALIFQLAERRVAAMRY